jgi:mannosyltransferase
MPNRNDRWRYGALLTSILVIAGVLRVWNLGRLSFWYDEVVTMRLARQPGPVELLAELERIDATRAPLHPLVLQAWIHGFGKTEGLARALSALCGMATVAAMAWIGTLAADQRTALWAAWLGALSPPLVYYSREARMYAWLVLLTCLAWGILLTLRARVSWSQLIAFGCLLVGLAYSHPLGLLMIFAIACAYLCQRSTYQLRLAHWGALHVLVALAIAPWVWRYFNHEPEFLTKDQSFKFLVGLPIGFTGGNRWVLLLALLLIAIGWTPHQIRLRAAVAVKRKLRHWTQNSLGQPSSATPLLVWFVLPPVMLYVYSQIVRPIFGPARYTLFVGPAYLILIAGGLARLPRLIRYPLAVGLAVLAGSDMTRTVFASDLKADWREAARFLDSRSRDVAVVVLSDNPGRNVEAETARYYLGVGTTVIAAESTVGATKPLLSLPSNEAWFAVGLRQGHPVAPVPPTLGRDWSAKERHDFPGLRLERWERVGAPP